ncbi:hypothetical protein HMPREF2534_01672 [Bacteroides thetaiotaomicron]|nr:hypothetical protein HMPREF2534_01672 [Bacteroides thetaiotaomicron]
MVLFLKVIISVIGIPFCLKFIFLDITAVYTYLSEIKMAEFLPLKREIHMFN